MKYYCPKDGRELKKSKYTFTSYLCNECKKLSSDYIYDEQELILINNLNACKNSLEVEDLFINAVQNNDFNAFCFLIKNTKSTIKSVNHSAKIKILRFFDKEIYCLGSYSSDIERLYDLLMNQNQYRYIREIVDNVYCDPVLSDTSIGSTFLYHGNLELTLNFLEETNQDWDYFINPCEKNGSRINFTHWCAMHEHYHILDYIIKNDIVSKKYVLKHNLTGGSFGKGGLDKFLSKNSFSQDEFDYAIQYYKNYTSCDKEYWKTLSKYFKI